MGIIFVLGLEIPGVPTSEVPENIARVEINNMVIEDQFVADFRQRKNDIEPLVKNYHQLEQDQELCQSLSDTMRVFKASLRVRSSTCLEMQRR